MMLNRAAAKLIGKSPVPEDTWHDWWSYIVVAACDGMIITNQSPDILYRQHGRNLVGETLSLWSRAVGALRAWDGPMSEQTRTHLAIIEGARHGGLHARIRALLVPGLVRQTWLETQVFRLWFLWGSR
jgi:hypothetical protein